MLKKSNLSMAEFNKFSIENGLGNIDGFINLENAVVNESDSNTSQKRSQNQKIPKSGQRFQDQFNLLNKYETAYLELT